MRALAIGSACFLGACGADERPQAAPESILDGGTVHDLVAADDEVVALIDADTDDARLVQIRATEIVWSLDTPRAPGTLDVDGEFVYWAECDGARRELWRAPRDSGEGEPVASLSGLGCVQWLGVDGGRAFVVGADAFLYEVSLEGDGLLPIYSEDAVTTCAAGGGALLCDIGRRLRMMDPDGIEAPVEIDVPPCPPDTACGLSIHDEVAHWTAEDVYAFDVHGADTPRVLTEGGGFRGRPSVDEDMVVVLHCEDFLCVLAWIPRTGGSATEFVRGGDPHAIAGGHIYFGETGIRRFSLAETQDIDHPCDYCPPVF